MNKCIELQSDSKLGSDELNTNLINIVHKALNKYKTSHERISIQISDCKDDTTEQLMKDKIIDLSIRPQQIKIMLEQTDHLIEEATPQKLDPSISVSKLQHSKIYCPLVGCEKHFNCPQKLIQHIKSHFSYRKYMCTYEGCQKSFKLFQHLSYHLTTHDKKSQKTFVCSYKGCGRRYRQNWILKDHEKTHENIYKFRCTAKGCDKKYSTKSNLDVHMRKHMGQKPF